MSREAIRHSSKVMQRCPYCRDNRPKELVEGPKRFSFVLYLIMGVVTCGIGLLTPSFFYNRRLEAYCTECERTFHIKR